jgi:hypothetical protein
MSRLYFSVKISRSGRPLWESIMIHPLVPHPPKAARLRKQRLRHKHPRQRPKH